MSKSNLSPKRSIANYAMKPLAPLKASSSLIIRPSIESTILPTQNRYTTIGTILHSPRNYLQAVTSLISPPCPKTHPIKLMFTQEIGYLSKKSKFPLQQLKIFKKLPLFMK